MMTLRVLIVIVLLLVPGFASAEDFYVRPAGTTYGSGSGQTYTDAWNNFEQVIWGESGVQAGDTLYVCGTHLRSVVSGGLIATQGAIIPGASGTAENPVVISGACPDDPGVIWGAWKDERPEGMAAINWVETSPGVYYNETQIYNKAFDAQGLYEKDGTNYRKYVRAGSAAEVEASPDSGVYYLEAFGTNQHRVWLRPFDQANFSENIRWSGVAGWRLVLSDENNYIVFRDLTVHASGIGHENQSASAGPYNNYSFINVKFFPYDIDYFYAPYNSHDILFDGVEIAYAGNGIYVIWSYGDNHDITVRNSYFHDIGGPYSSTPVDGHAIGIQNNERFYLYGNKFERCGSAIDFHVGEAKTQRHIHIVGNYITDMRVAYAKETIAPGVGIQLEGSNDVPKNDTEDMLIAYNIVNGCEGIGIATTRKDEVVIHNNTVKGCDINYLIVGNRIDGASAAFFNNVSLSPRTDRTNSLHVYFRQNYDGIQYNFSGNNNLYYPDGVGKFDWVQTGITSTGSDFTAWKANHALAGNTVDSNGLTSDPMFINITGVFSEPVDFYPGAGSPLIGEADTNYVGTIGFLDSVIVTPTDIGAAQSTKNNVLEVSFESSGLVGTLSATTTASAACRYGDLQSLEWAQMSAMTTTGATLHSQQIALVPGAISMACVRCIDGGDQITEPACASYFVPPQPKNPVLMSQVLQ